MVDHLGRHVRREEAGVFTALREDGEFADEVAQLEAEHEDLAAAIAGLDVAAPDLEARIRRLFDDLAEHIEREDLGIFPVSVVSLGAGGWQVVDRAHTAEPSFLRDPHPQPSRAPR
jgi:hemerythrin-like domain-containing protein